MERRRETPSSATAAPSQISQFSLLAEETTPREQSLEGSRISLSFQEQHTLDSSGVFRKSVA